MHPPGSVPWVRALGRCPGSVPWVRALGRCPGSVPWVRALGPCPGSAVQHPRTATSADPGASRGTSADCSTFTDLGIRCGSRVGASIWGSRGRGFKSRRPVCFSNASSPCTAAVQQCPRKTLKVCMRPVSGRHAAGGFKITTLGRGGFASRVLRVVRHERRTSLTASPGCWHAYPVGVSAVLTLAPGSSPWRLQSAHGGTPLTSRTVTAGPGCGARDPPLCAAFRPSGCPPRLRSELTFLRG